MLSPSLSSLGLVVHRGASRGQWPARSPTLGAPSRLADRRLAVQDNFTVIGAGEPGRAR